ncbi:MAG TPA: type II toxin-antitoxin system prevent-host-death family antitoxin [Oleiagrimonas sp.]|nr:type II toxin-antitoxin system prevent-host-death family antitoxin [Oleiagrimonas sp.]
MPTEIGSYEAKTHLPELLRQVRAGKSFTITSRGKAVAELTPVRHSTEAEAGHAVERMKTFMRTHRVEGINIKALVEEGRR